MVIASICQISNGADMSNLLFCKRTPVYGVGINDADYAVQSISSGSLVVCPAYSAWKSMLYRVYGARNRKNRTYEGVSVCDEWLVFSKFKLWWDENHVSGWKLDKDVIGVGNLYSPDNCIYLPNWINTMLSDVACVRGEFLIGVNKVGSKYRANCRHPFNKGSRHLGYFTTEADAHNAWLCRKLEIANELKPLIDDVDVRIYKSLSSKIQNMR